jgi:Xaa-Pro dipeptidase
MANIDLLASTVREFGLGAANIGLELGAASSIRMTPDELGGLKSALPEVAFVDCDEAVGRSRMVKSAMEIARIRKTVEIAESGYLAAFRAAAPGMTERDLIAIIAEEWLMQGGETPYNGNNYEYLALQAGRILQMTPSPVDRKIERGDLIQIDGGRASAGTRRTFTATPISGRICLRRYTSMRRERAS